MITDKGLIVRLFPEYNFGFRKQVVLIKFSDKESAGIEFHHDKVELLSELDMGDFVQISYEIKSKVNDERIYNNLIGMDIKKIC